MRFASALILLAGCSFDPPQVGGTPDGTPDGAVELTVVSSGPTGAGRIASSDQMIDCSVGSTQTCTARYPVGIEVMLAANINTGFALSTNWPGCAPTSAA